MKSVAHSEAPALHYIGAARAANRLNEPTRRDNYLRKAEDMPGRDSLAVGLVEAEIMLDNKEYSQARDLLVRLRRQYPNNPRMLALLAQAYKALGQWNELREIMPQAQKHKALTESEFVALQGEMYRELLDAAARKGALAELKALWSAMPPALRSTEPVLIDYVGHLRDNNAAGEAETLLRGTLRQQWSDKLVVGYGEIGRGDAAGQLQAAEGWLGQHENNPYLLLTLGRLAKRSRQFEKARKYLEQSISTMPSPDAFQELGDLLEQTDNKDAANQCYRTGLRLVSGQPEARGEGVELLPAARAEDKAGGGERQAEEKSVAKPSGKEPVLQ
jgi:HemY protein